MNGTKFLPSPSSFRAPRSGFQCLPWSMGGLSLDASTFDVHARGPSRPVHLSGPARTASRAGPNKLSGRPESGTRLPEWLTDWSLQAVDNFKGANHTPPPGGWGGSSGGGYPARRGVGPARRGQKENEKKTNAKSMVAGTPPISAVDNSRFPFAPYADHRP